MSFNYYYGSLLRRRVRSVPRADEARRDYRELSKYATLIGLI